MKFHAFYLPDISNYTSPKLNYVNDNVISQKGYKDERNALEPKEFENIALLLKEIYPSKDCLNNFKSYSIADVFNDKFNFTSKVSADVINNITEEYLFVQIKDQPDAIIDITFKKDASGSLKLYNMNLSNISTELINTVSEKY
jgi:hypothetical protein